MKFDKKVADFETYAIHAFQILNHCEMYQLDQKWRESSFLFGRK